MSDLKERIHAKMREPVLSALATLTGEGLPWVRYVTPVMDPDLNIWFTTALGSRKVSQIKSNPEVHLTTGVISLETAESYLQVQGRAEILTDAETKKRMWHEYLARIFSGPDDPDYCVVKIKPYRIELQGMSMEPAEVWNG